MDDEGNQMKCPYCKQNAWRAAFVAERAMRYREGGMTIEQARIHAETDAAHMEALAASQQPAADSRICRVCDGGPGNDSSCLCGHRKWEQPAAVDGDSAEALKFLLSRIGSWTDARWDQHLRHEFGDVRAERMIAAIAGQQGGEK